MTIPRTGLLLAAQDYSAMQTSVPVKPARLVPYITIANCFDSRPRIDSAFQKTGFRSGLLEKAKARTLLDASFPPTRCYPLQPSLTPGNLLSGMLKDPRNGCPLYRGHYREKRLLVSRDSPQSCFSKLARILPRIEQYLGEQVHGCTCKFRSAVSFIKNTAQNVPVPRQLPCRYFRDLGE
jgi:hypothetical protein